MTVLGVDLSHFNVVNWEALKVGFVIHKATEGTTFKDPAYAARMRVAEEMRIPFAAYHFLNESSPQNQADFAYSVVGNQVPLHLDIESEGTSEPSLLQARQFTARYKANGGKVGLWYLPHWYWSGIWSSPVLAENDPDIWQSVYPANNKAGQIDSRYVVVGGDQNAAWAAQGRKPVRIWQFGSQGVVPGVTGTCDIDAYKDGTVADMAADGYVTTWAAPKPPVKPQRMGWDMYLLKAQTGVVLVQDGKRFGLNTALVADLQRQGVPMLDTTHLGTADRLYALGTGLLENLTPTDY